jgi:hypothetical protein
MKRNSVFALVLAVGLSVQVAQGSIVTTVYSNDFSAAGSLAADGWWVEAAGEGVIANGYVSLYDKATYSLGGVYALDSSFTGADYYVDELWLRCSVKVPTEAQNGRAVTALGNSVYYAEADGTDSQYEFGKFAGLWLYDDSSTSTKTMCAGRLSTYTTVFDSDFMDIVLRITDEDGLLQTQMWFDPVDLDNLGSPQKTNIKAYEDKYVGMGYEGLLDQIELNAYNFTGGMQIDEMVVWTETVPEPATVGLLGIGSLFVIR